MRKHRKSKAELTVLVDGVVYSPLELVKIQKGCLSTARRRMREYNRGELSSLDLMRELRDGQGVFTGPEGFNMTGRELRKLVKLSPDEARERLNCFEQGEISLEQLTMKSLHTKKERTNQGSAAWQALLGGTSGKEQRRMAKALLKLPEPAKLEAKYINPRGSVFGQHDPDYIMNPFIK